MPLPDLSAEIIALALGVISIIVSFTILRFKTGNGNPPPSIPETPSVDGVADAGRIAVVEEAEREAEAVADAEADEHPATALADLVNARKRER